MKKRETERFLAVIYCSYSFSETVHTTAFHKHMHLGNSFSDAKVAKISGKTRN